MPDILGLVAAVFLARAGLKVTVLEEGRPSAAPVRQSVRSAKSAQELATLRRGSDICFGLMPPELLAKLGVDIPLAGATRTTSCRRWTRATSSSARTARRWAQFLTFFSERDWKANEALTAELGLFAKTWPPRGSRSRVTVEGTAERYVRPALREAFVDLCRKLDLAIISLGSTSRAISSAPCTR